MDAIYSSNQAFKNYISSIKINRSEVLTYYEFIRIVEQEYNCKFIPGSENFDSHLQFSNPADATLFTLKWS